MNEDRGFHRRVRHKPTYITIPRKLMTAWIVSFICMLIMTIVSVQWANYINRRSSQRLCSVVTLFNKAYKATPPTTKLGKDIAAAMLNWEKLEC